MDYDKTGIAGSYDLGRGYSSKVLRQWLDVISTHIPKDVVSDIVDLGCGTGRYSEALAAHFGANLVGIDPSEKMLEQARTKLSRDDVVYRRGFGEALPMADASADMIFMSMVLHHLEDPDQVARECHRVLRPGGYVCLRASTTDTIELIPYVEFFAGSRAILKKRLTSIRRTRAIFESAHFSTVLYDTISQAVATDWIAYADKLSHRVDSILASLPNNDFQRGLAALRAYAEQADPNMPVIEEIDFFVFRQLGAPRTPHVDVGSR